MLTVADKGHGCFNMSRSLNRTQKHENTPNGKHKHQSCDHSFMKTENFFRWAWAGTLLCVWIKQALLAGRSSMQSTKCIFLHRTAKTANAAAAVCSVLGIKSVNATGVINITQIQSFHLAMWHNYWCYRRRRISENKSFQLNQQGFEWKGENTRKWK